MEKLKSLFSIKTIFLIVALIPLIALLLIFVNLVSGSWLAITNQGFKLFSGTFSVVNGPYGLLPAIWGTVLVVIISMTIAVPASMAIAVLPYYCSSPVLGLTTRWTLGVFSGIPPIIYAVVGSTFFSLFFWPKFMGEGLSADQLPAAGMMPSDSSCTLLGGIMLALLVIPFMAPLIDDALQNVSKSLQEASYSLGANRWHTLTRVTLPSALPGIVSALTLGILTALGEAIIVGYTIGYTAPKLPNPFFDVLERIAPLTSTVAGLSAGSFSRSQLTGPVGQSTSSFIGLLLLILAFVILFLTGYLRNRLNRRVTG